MKVRGYVYNEQTGLVASGRNVLVKKRLPTPSTLTTLVSASDGSFDYEVSGSPGLLDFVTQDGPPYRILFGDVSLPRWGGWTDGELGDLLRTLSNGVVVGVDNDLQILAPGGMFVQFATGLAKLKTGLHRQRAAENVAVPANISGSTRTDSCGIRMYLSGSDIWKTEKYYKSGSVAVVDDATMIELQLATIAVANNASSIVIGNITDVRTEVTFPIAYINAAVIGDGTVTDLEFAQLSDISTASTIQAQLNAHTTGLTGKADDFTQYATVSIMFGNGVDVIDSSEPYQIFEMPESYTLERWCLDADVTGSIEFNVAKAASNSTSYSDIDGTNPPKMTSQKTLNSTDMTTWTAGPYNQGQKIKVTVVGSATSIKRCLLSFRFSKARD